MSDPITELHLLARTTLDQAEDDFREEHPEIEFYLQGMNQKTMVRRVWRRNDSSETLRGVTFVARQDLANDKVHLLVDVELTGGHNPPHRETLLRTEEVLPLDEEKMEALRNVLTEAFNKTITASFDSPPLRQPSTRGHPPSWFILTMAFCLVALLLPPIDFFDWPYNLVYGIALAALLAIVVAWAILRSRRRIQNGH